MTTAENIALIGDNDNVQYKFMLARAQSESICEEHDEYEGVSVSEYTFPDGSVLQVCSGRMEAIK